MKTSDSILKSYSVYNDFFNKVVDEIKMIDSKKESEEKRQLLNDLEKAIGGKKLILDCNK